MNIADKRLELLATILKYMEMEIIHQFEDLVFVSDNLFVLKLTASAMTVELYFNEAVEEETAQQLMAQLDALGELHDLMITYKGAFGLDKSADGSLSVSFFDLLEG